MPRCDNMAHALAPLRPLCGFQHVEDTGGMMCLARGESTECGDVGMWECDGAGMWDI